jgi:hypothetical protein
VHDSHIAISWANRGSTFNTERKRHFWKSLVESRAWRDSRVKIVKLSQDKRQKCGRDVYKAVEILVPLTVEGYDLVGMPLNNTPLAHRLCSPAPHDTCTRRPSQLVACSLFSPQPLSPVSSPPSQPLAQASHHQTPLTSPRCPASGSLARSPSPLATCTPDRQARCAAAV